jgi:hypothetical protein
MLSLRTTLSGLATFGLLALPAAAQSALDTFEGGVNQGGWTYGAPNETIPPTGGNPGAHLYNPFVDSFAPTLRSTNPAAPFHGDWRAMGVDTVTFDLRVWHTDFAYQREATLMLSDGVSTVYRLGTEFIPQVSVGWKSFEIAVDSQSPTLPPGWFSFSGGDPDTEWNAVIQNVTEVSVFYGDPTFFYIFMAWELSVDNFGVFASPGTNYCTATPNSSGDAATIEALGSNSVSDNAFVLRADSVLPNQPGIFFYGPEQANVPFGNGVRCVGAGATGFERLDVITPGNGGTMLYQLDLTDPPSVDGTILPGSTWYFQAWYRDPAAGGSNFNLSDGVGVTFQP